MDTSKYQPTLQGLQAAIHDYEVIAAQLKSEKPGDTLTSSQAWRLKEWKDNVTDSVSEHFVGKLREHVWKAIEADHRYTGVLYDELKSLASDVKEMRDYWLKAEQRQESQHDATEDDDETDRDTLVKQGEALQKLIQALPTIIQLQGGKLTNIPLTDNGKVKLSNLMKNGSSKPRGRGAGLKRWRWSVDGKTLPATTQPTDVAHVYLSDAHYVCSVDDLRTYVQAVGVDLDKGTTDPCRVGFSVRINGHDVRGWVE